MYGNELGLFWAKTFKILVTIYVAHLTSVGVTFNDFGYDAVLPRNSNLSPSRQHAQMLRFTPQSRVRATVYDMICVFRIKIVISVVALYWWTNRH